MSQAKPMIGRQAKFYWIIKWKWDKAAKGGKYDEELVKKDFTAIKPKLYTEWKCSTVTKGWYEKNV
jgi:hypothetical protein